MDKIKVLTISDHPFSPSGVGTQTKYVLNALLKTGKFQIISLGGAIKHQNYNPQKTEEYGDDWIILPVDGYGDAQTIRSILRMHKPDILWFMTDPRFFTWLWEIENEIRALVPMVYYHVWDNFPYPTFNKVLYESNDKIVTISKLTSNIVKNVAPNVEEVYIPHAVDENIFKDLPKDEVEQFRKQNFPTADGKLIFFWNSRNARRKQSGTLIWWFKEFLDKVGDKAILLMHTDPRDEHGQDLNQIIDRLNLQGKVLLSTQKIPPQHLALLYNAVDCTLSVSDAEGFGLSTFESLSCGTPIIVTMTGGLQEQVTEIKEVSESLMLERNKKNPVTVYSNGIGIEPVSKAIIGSQQVPYIYEDRLRKEHFLEALEKFLNMEPELRRDMGLNGQKHVRKNYSFSNFEKAWVDTLTEVHEKFGSWENRKGYKTWEIRSL